MEQVDFAKGILIGGCIGSVMALLLAPKAGKDLRHDIVDGYNAINEYSHEYADDIKDQACNIKEQACSFMDTLQEKEQHSHALLFGSVSGAIIGTLAALLLAPQAGSKLRKQLGDKYEEIREKAERAVDEFQHTSEDQLEDWKDTFVTILDKISSCSKNPHKASGGFHLKEIGEWASLGLRLYHQLQERR